MEHRTQPVNPLADLLGGTHNVALEKAADRGVRPVLVLIVDSALENFVLAVLRPSLRQCFEFDVRGRRTQPVGLPPCTALRIVKVRLDGLHLGQIQGQQPLLTEAQQGVVVEVQRYGGDARRVVGTGNRRRQECLGAVAPIGRCRDTPLVHQGVGE